jgi:hypothetical protein
MTETPLYIVRVTRAPVGISPRWNITWACWIRAYEPMEAQDGPDGQRESTDFNCAGFKASASVDDHQRGDHGEHTPRHSYLAEGEGLRPRSAFFPPDRFVYISPMSFQCLRSPMEQVLQDLLEIGQQRPNRGLATLQFVTATHWVQKTSLRKIF